MTLEQSLYLMIGRTRAGSLNFGRFKFFLRGLFGVSEAFEVNSNSSLNSHSGDGCKEGRKLGSRSVVLGNHAVVDNVVEDVEVGSGVVVVVDLVVVVVVAVVVVVVVVVVVLVVVVLLVVV